MAVIRPVAFPLIRKTVLKRGDLIVFFDRKGKDQRTIRSEDVVP